MKSQIEILEVYITLLHKTLGNEHFEAAKDISDDLMAHFAKVKAALVEQEAPAIVKQDKAPKQEKPTK